MVRAPIVAAIAAIAPLANVSTAPLLASAFTTSHFSPPVVRPSSWALSAGKGFGDKPTPAARQKPSADETTTAAAPSAEDQERPPPEENKGSQLLATLRSREAEKRDDELRKLRELRETDALLSSEEGADAAAIPERVAQRMGRRMLPFVGVPLFGSAATFVGFWYLATYKDMEFQPALVATTSFVFLAIGLLGITYSMLSANWDDDGREGSTLGVDEFQKNVGSLREGLSRTKENALLREKMAGLSEDEIQRAIDGQERREKGKKKKDAWME